MAKFCPECANPIIDSSMPFCPKCGMKLPVTTPAPQPSDKHEESQELAPKFFEFFGCKVNKDTKELEYRTGIGIIDNSFNFNEKSQPTTPYGSNSVKEAKKDLNYLGNIVFGILIIIALYIFPIKTFEGRNFSIADLTSICSNPIGIMIGGSDCNLWNMVFYGGWVIAIVFIIFGVIQISRVGKYGKE